MLVLDRNVPNLHWSNPREEGRGSNNPDCQIVADYRPRAKRNPRSSVRVGMPPRQPSMRELMWLLGTPTDPIPSQDLL